jgi:hypothetical protein
VKEETYQQTLYFGDKIDAEEDASFVLSQVLFIAAGDTDAVRIARSVGNGELRLKRSRERETD